MSSTEMLSKPFSLMSRRADSMSLALVRSAFFVYAMGPAESSFENLFLVSDIVYRKYRSHAMTLGRKCFGIKFRVQGVRGGAVHKLESTASLETEKMR